MRLNCKVVWLNPSTGRKQFVDISSSMAMTVARKKVADDMQEVTIYVSGAEGDELDESWPPIEVPAYGVEPHN